MGIVLSKWKSGLVDWIEVDKGGRVYTILDAPHRNIHPPGWAFVAILLRHARAVYEDRIDDAGHRKDRWY